MSFVDIIVSEDITLKFRKIKRNEFEDDKEGPFEITILRGTKGTLETVSMVAEFKVLKDVLFIDLGTVTALKYTIF